MEIKLFSCKNVCIFCLVFVQGNNMQKLCRKLAMFPSLRKWAGSRDIESTATAATVTAAAADTGVTYLNKESL